MNHEQLVTIIENGRMREASSDEIADEILNLDATEIDTTWAKAMSHPLRAEIVGLLRREGPLSPVRAADQLDGTLGTIAYHFRTLDKLGVIEVCDEIPRRGAVEHIYQLAEPAGHS